MPSSISSRSRATSTAAPTCASSTPRARATSSRRCGGRRQAARPHGRDGRRRTTRGSTTPAPRRGRRRWSASRASTGRSSSRRSSSARATASSTSSPGSSGSRRASSPCPGDGRRRFQPIHADDVARSSSARWRTDDHRRAFELGGPRYWTYREITREVLTAMGERRMIVPMPVAAHPAGGRGAELVRIAVPGRHRPAAQLRLDNIGPLDVDPDAVRLRAAPWRATSATCARGSATRRRRGRR